MMMTKEQKRERNIMANKAVSLLSGMDDEQETAKIVKATELGDINALALIMQAVIRRAVVRWNSGWRPGGQKTPAKHVRQETKEQELVRFKRLHKQPSAKVKCGVKNTQTSDEPKLDPDDILSFAEPLWFEEYIATGELARLQAELGATHGFYTTVKKAFGRARCRYRRHEKKHRMSSLDNRVSLEDDGLPMTYGAEFMEDESLLGRAGAGESLQEREHGLYLAIQARAVEQLQRHKDGKLLTAIASRLDWPVRRISHWLKENGSKISKSKVAYLVNRVNEVMQSVGRDDLDTEPDTDTEPCCQRIGKVLPMASRVIGKAPARRFEFNSVRSFPDSSVDKTQYADEVTIAYAYRHSPASKADNRLGDREQEAQEAKRAEVDAKLITNGMADVITEVDNLVKIKEERQYSKLGRPTASVKPIVGKQVTWPTALITFADGTPIRYR